MSVYVSVCPQIVYSTEGPGGGTCRRLTCVFESLGKPERLSDSLVRVTEGLATSVAGGTAPDERLVLAMEVEDVEGRVLLLVVWVFAAAAAVVATVTVEVEGEGVTTMVEVAVGGGATTCAELGLSVSETSSILGMSGRRSSAPDVTITLVGRDQPAQVVGNTVGEDSCVWYHRYVCAFFCC